MTEIHYTLTTGC